MSEQTPSVSPATDLPKAAVVPQRRLSLVWVVPIIALLIGAGLVYTAMMEKGPTVHITFESAEGIEAGKTKVKFKDVEIGEVDSVVVTEDMQSVRVTVELVKEAEDYLTEKTRFWVVRPRLSGGTVSGLGTLLSGSYIAVDPGMTGKKKYEFVGLEIPPVITGDSPGKLFTLRADELGSLDYGSPVYYRGIKVGQVAGYSLHEEGDVVDVTVFIDAPHDKIITKGSRFWFASGLDMNLGVEGVRIDTESLMSFLIGGVAVATPPYLGKQPPADAGTVFPLHRTRDTAMAEQFTNKEYYVLKFDQSVRGLSVGAPVEFKGFLIGRVVDIGIEFDWERNEVLVPVRVEVEQERLNRIASGADIADDREALDLLVEQGMRGQMRTGNLITGKLYVALDFFDNAKPAKIREQNGILEIPTVDTPLEEITSNLTALLEKLQKLPMEEISSEIVQAIRSVKDTSNKFGVLVANDMPKAAERMEEAMDRVKRLSASLEAEMPATVVQARNAIKDMNALVSKDSATVIELQRALRELSEAARAIRNLAEQLERHPESLLKGKGRK